MGLPSKNLFLIDGLGALLSAFLLGIVLVYFESSFGMPRAGLYFLSGIACILATFSLTNYFLIKETRKLYLKLIGYANLLYCCLTLALTLYFYHEITVLGVIYFLGELSIIVTLAAVELRIAYK